jgi:hypothetical protein
MSEGGEDTASGSTETAVVSPASNPGAANLRPWRPGESGNPAGGSKLARELREYIAGRTKEDIDAIRLLAETAESEKVRLQARTWLAEQVIGKASQPLTDAAGNLLRTVGIIIMPAERNDLEDGAALVMPQLPGERSDDDGE